MFHVSCMQWGRTGRLKVLEMREVYLLSMEHDRTALCGLHLIGALQSGGVALLSIDRNSSLC